jgi:hypothetical protein
MAAVACLLAGCGAGDGLDRYPVKGTVTFQGQPVKDGSIFFEPTASVGKVAPTVYLRVTGGKYEVPQKEGPVAGKYKVVVGGKDASSTTVDDGITYTKQLFEDYRFEVEIPPSNNTLDVEVPASQALRKR